LGLGRSGLRTSDSVHVTHVIQVLHVLHVGNVINVTHVGHVLKVSHMSGMRGGHGQRREGDGGRGGGKETATLQRFQTTETMREHEKPRLKKVIPLHTSTSPSCPAGRHNDFRCWSPQRGPLRCDEWCRSG
jgi:hypothetical protein